MAWASILLLRRRPWSRVRPWVLQLRWNRGHKLVCIPQLYGFRRATKPWCGNCLRETDDARLDRSGRFAVFFWPICWNRDLSRTLGTGGLSSNVWGSWGWLYYLFFRRTSGAWQVSWEHSSRCQIFFVWICETRPSSVGQSGVKTGCVVPVYEDIF